MPLIWKLINENMTKIRVQGTTWKEQMPLPNIHINNVNIHRSVKKLKMLVPYPL